MKRGGRRLNQGGDVSLREQRGDSLRVLERTRPSERNHVPQTRGAVATLGLWRNGGHDVLGTGSHPRLG